MITAFKVDGLLGWNAIRQMRMRINYHDKTTTISDPRKQPAAAARNLFALAEPLVGVTDERGRLRCGDSTARLHMAIIAI